MDNYRVMFFWAAIWNFLVGGGIVLFPEFQFQFFHGVELAEQHYLALFFRAFGMSVLVFGLGYHLVSRDPVGNRGIVWLGILGKILVFLLFTQAFLNQQVTAMGLAGAVGDLLWAVAFLYFLYRARLLPG